MEFSLSVKPAGITGGRYAAQELANFGLLMM
jgi:hypothetical protein